MRYQISESLDLYINNISQHEHNSNVNFDVRISSLSPYIYYCIKKIIKIGISILKFFLKKLSNEYSLIDVRNYLIISM